MRRKHPEATDGELLSEQQLTRAHDRGRTARHGATHSKRWEDMREGEGDEARNLDAVGRPAGLGSGLEVRRIPKRRVEEDVDVRMRRRECIEHRRGRPDRRRLGCTCGLCGGCGRGGRFVQLHARKQRVRRKGTARHEYRLDGAQRKLECGRGDAQRGAPIRDEERRTDGTQRLRAQEAHLESARDGGVRRVHRPRRRRLAPCQVVGEGIAKAGAHRSTCTVVVGRAARCVQGTSRRHHPVKAHGQHEQRHLN